MKFLYIIIFSTLMLGSSFSYADNIIEGDFDVITEFLPSAFDDVVYIFDIDKSINLDTWVHDTSILIYDGTETKTLTDELFMSPMELHEDDSYLYLTVLNVNCVGLKTCDFQDVIKISKTDGQKTVLLNNLKSVVHLSLNENKIFVSESDGKIWQMNKDGSSLELLIENNNLIMDIAATNNSVYWTVELAADNTSIQKLDLTSGKVFTIKDNILHLYGLNSQNDSICWNEISFGGFQGLLSEFTSVMKYLENENEIKIIDKYRNKTPLEKDPLVNHSQYKVIDDFLFLVNNTNKPLVVHMQNIHNNTQYDFVLSPNMDDVTILTAQGNSLFAVGVTNEQKIIVEHHTLPVVVPEFSNVLMFILVSSFSIVFLGKFYKNSLLLKR